MKFRSTILALALTFVTGTSCLSSAKPRGLPRRLVDWVLKDACSSGCTQDQLADYGRNIRFELHDLNGDKIPEIFVYIDHSDLCGNHFNCDYSVFQRQSNGYRLIAGGTALRVTNIKTHGYRNLGGRHDIGVCVFGDGTMGRDVFVSVFRYKGKEYTSTDLGEQCREPIRIPTFRVGRIQ